MPSTIVQKTVVRTTLWACGALLVVGCSVDDAEQDQVHKTRMALSGSAVGVPFAVFDMARGALGDNELSARAATVAAILYDSKNLPVAGTISKDRSTRPFSVYPSLRVAYRSQRNDLLLTREDLFLGGRPQSDIGEVAARLEAERVLAALEQAGVVSPGAYPMKNAKVSYRRSGIGRRGQPPSQEWIDEYRYRIVRDLNGIPCAHSRLLIGVHSTGVRSTVRLGEVVVSANAKDGLTQPSGSGLVKTRTVDDISIRAHFERAYPGEKIIRHQGVMYLEPEPFVQALVAPRYVVVFARKQTMGSGVQPVVGRPMAVGFSLTDLKAPPTVLFPKSVGTALPGDSKPNPMAP